MMKRIFLKCFLIFIYMFTGEARAIDNDSLNRNEVAVTFDASLSDLETQLVSLDSIIEVAMKNSPYLKYDSTLADAQESDIKLARRSFYNHVSGFFNYSTGNQRFLISGAENNTQNNFLNGYRLGLNVTIPLSEFANRGLRVKREKSEFEAQKYKMEQTELELKRQITQEYNNLIAAQKLLKIKSSGVENARVLHQMAEKQFREGTATLQDYASVSDMAIKAEVDYELAKSGFRSAYYSFQNLVGVQLTSLMKKK